jgi:hypothetical protein
MGGETRTESSTGATTDSCRTNVAKKLGELAVSQVGPQILGYAKIALCMVKKLPFL